LQSHLGLGWIARKRGDDEAALEHFRTASEFNPLDLQPRIALARLLELMHRYLEAEAVYQRVIAQAPDHPQALKALGAMALKRYDWAGALEHLRAAAKSDPKNIQVRIDLGRAFCGLSRWDDAERNYKSILEDSPGNVEAMIGLADTAKGRGDTQSARAWFEEAAAAAPLDFRLKQEIRRLKAAQDGYDWKAELEDAVAVARSASASVRSQMEAVEILIKYGLTEVARPALLRLEASLPDARRFLMAVRQIERSGLAQPLTASGDVDPAENQLESLRGFIEIPVPKTDTLLIVFGGTNNRVSITFSLLHKILRKTGVSIVYCRDLQQEWYTQGVVGLGDDFQSTVDGFRALAKQHGAKRILIVGSCVGCYAALRFGLSLNAQAVLGLGPKIGTVDDILQPHERTRLTGIRERLPPGYKTIHVLYHETAALPKVDLVFGEHFTVDACGLSSLADVPGITITGIPDSDDPVKDLLVRGLLEPLLREFVAKGTVSPELHAQISTSATPQYSHAE
ncbi:MAG: tetratricopeptide repeat protein, partial [Bryobacteraceae bacterium]